MTDSRRRGRDDDHPRWRARLLLALIVLALAVRAIYSLTLENRPYWYDAEAYHSLASQLVATGHYMTPEGEPTAFWPPGYPFFLAAVYAVSGPSPLAARLAQTLLGALTVWLVYAVARRLVGKRSALLAALVTAFYPLYVHTAGSLYPVVWVTFLLAALFLLILQTAERESPRRSLLAGLLGGLIALTTPSALSALLLIAVWLGWFECHGHRLRAAAPTGSNSIAEPREEGRGWTGLRSALCFLIPVILILGVWGGRNVVALGHPVIGSTNGGFNLWLGNHPDATATRGNQMTPAMLHEIGALTAAHRDEVARDRALTLRAIEYIRADPGRFVRLSLQKAANLWSLYQQPMTEDRPRFRGEVWLSLLSYGLLLPFALFWFFRALWHDPRAWLVFLIFLAYTVVHAIFIAKVRFRLPLDFLIIAYGAGGVLAAWDAIRRRIPSGGRSIDQRGA